MPLPLLTTPHLTLQPFSSDDLDALHALWTDPHVRRYLWDDIVITRERAAQTLNTALATAASDGIGHWTLRFEPDGTVIGDCGFQFIPSTRKIELMCCLLQPYWGKGLASEACKTAIGYARSLNYARVHGRADIPNRDSIRLMERLGMRYLSDDGRLVTYVLFPLDGLQESR